MKIYSLTTMLLLFINVYGCSNDCAHIGKYQGSNVYMCDENTQQSQNIELNINIKIPSSGQIPKVIKTLEPINSNALDQIGYFNNESLTNNTNNENNTSLYNNQNNSLISPSPITTPSSASAPSPTTVPSSVTTPSPTTVPSSVTTPSPTTVPSSVLEPSPVTVPSSVLEPSPVTVPSSVLEPSPVTVPSSIIIDDINNQKTEPSPRLRGTKNNTVNETSNELLRKNNDQPIVVNEQPNLGVVITLSVVITVLTMTIIAGVIYKVKTIKRKVTVGNVEVDTTEFRRKFEEAKRMKENEQKNNLETNIKLNTAKPIKKLKSKPVLNKKVKTIANHPKLPEAKKVPAKLPAPPIRKKRIITDTPPPGMGFKKGDPAPEPNKSKRNEPVTPTSEC